MSVAVNSGRSRVTRKLPLPDQPLAMLAIIVAVAAMYLPVTTALIGQGDFPLHIAIAEDLIGGTVRVPHLLFHTAVALGMLAGLPAGTAAIVVTLTFEVAAAACVFWFVRRYAPAAPVVAATVSIAMVAVGPILPSDADHSLFMTGHFLANSIHNPTVIAAKAFVPALLAIGTSAGLTAAAFLPWTAAAGIVILAGLAKPHYVSCIVPAAIACAGVRVLHGTPVPWRFMLLGLVAPGAAVLVWGTVGTAEITSGGWPIFAPRAVLGHYVPVDAISILYRLGLDIAFPVAVALLWPSAVVRFPPLAFAWIAFGIALAQAFLLAESGPRMFDGNFMWSAQLAMFGLMTASAAFLAQQPFTVRAAIAWGVLLLHVAHWIIWVRFHT